ncbi:two-component sensor histidine kinase [Cohnella sp. CIP 111063]|uniref:sensor histidine kinase n=1 Tax=unclassified Cohnella TaxID=2636738 RepID=UPI000B8C39D6|nr:MULTISPECIES: sensor histidine kinase [unclassified Cohnella]OXS58768.1 two-component sensor histidine kinase [Cohnella sp. CIP 111063]PRX71847.1 HAMP domain-containing protein [Cohnella sp. SGD-V74]
MGQEKKRNFQESTRRLFRLYTLIPFGILIALFFAFTIVNGRMAVEQRSAQATQAMAESIGEVYRQYERETLRMAESPAVLDYVRTKLGSEKVYAEFYEFNNRQKVKSVFHIVSMDGVFLASSAPPDALNSDQAFGNLLHRISVKPEALLAETNGFRYSYDRITSYTFGKAIVEEGRTIGYLVYQLFETDLQKLIFLRNNEVAVVTAEHNTIVATTSNITKGILNKFQPSAEGSGKVLLNGGEYGMHTREIPGTPIKVHALNSLESGRDTVITLSIFVVAASLLLWIVIHFLAQKMSSRNAESIDKLVRAFRHLRVGNLNEYVDIRTGDEFQTLGEKYNYMLDRLRELMDKNQELSRISNLVEIKQLQSQFHPHFIFNVLETLRYAIKADAGKAQEIVMLLSRLLRYSVGHERSVRLEDDLGYVRDYLKLQQIRFNERLKYNIEVTGDAGNLYVPKLILQAVIENSIKYGYRNQSSLHIDIFVFASAGKLMLEVADDGQGMTKERLEQVNRILTSPENTTEHIGLYNVHRRLVLLYGEEYGIQIASKPGSGTKVTLTIPYEEGEGHV